ncbi:MAG TPA: acyl-CoA dehydrogenase family protein [Terriglobales bacterium]|nr:acyl-CoA dehydrogenase family protein [Terriglobales bacterium]
MQTAKWAMEVYGGVGTLQEYCVERWLREAMILAIWEGTSHRQMLDGRGHAAHQRTQVAVPACRRQST